LRIFIAAILPEEIKDYIEKYIYEIKDSITGVKWEKREKFHITLKFIGKIYESDLQRIGSSLKNFIVNKNSISLNIIGLDGFPNLNNPRVLIVRFVQSVLLNDIKYYIDTELGSMGIPEDNRLFIPHATIGRVKSKFSITNTLPDLENRAFNINRIEIVNSILSNRGSIYNTCYKFNLQ
jgi:RNA 2',3'-cyclic 3'-phosphodiesterase